MSRSQDIFNMLILTTHLRSVGIISATGEKKVPSCLELCNLSRCEPELK